jgi:hypothetical protein
MRDADGIVHSARAKGAEWEEMGVCETAVRRIPDADTILAKQTTVRNSGI